MTMKSNYYSRAMLDRLRQAVSAATSRTEASLLREALDDLLAKHRDRLLTDGARRPRSTFVRDHRNGVLVTRSATVARSCRTSSTPSTTPASIRISITADRAKAKNLARAAATRRSTSPGTTSGPYVVLDADVELSAVAAAPDDAAVDELGRPLPRPMVGEHDDWDDYAAAMVRDQRRRRPPHPHPRLRHAPRRTT